jgi:hypothetical protein
MAQLSPFAQLLLVLTGICWAVVFVIWIWETYVRTREQSREPYRVVPRVWVYTSVVVSAICVVTLIVEKLVLAR